MTQGGAKDKHTDLAKKDELDLAALFVSNRTIAEGPYGSARGSDWPDYWWYSVLSLENSLERKICGARITNGDVCLEDPGDNDRCAEHEHFTFHAPNPDGAYSLDAAKNFLISRISHSFVKKCSSACVMIGECQNPPKGEPCFRELDVYNNIILHKLADSVKVGIPLTFTQLIGLRRSAINEIQMLRNDELIAREGTTVRLEKLKETRYGTESEETYIVNPALMANTYLNKENKDLMRESLMTSKVQHESKIAEKNAESKKLNAASKEKAADILEHVLKEVNDMPAQIPGVGSMDEVLAAHANSNAKVTDDHLNEEKKTIDIEPEQSPGESVAVEGQVVVDEDNNPSVIDEEGNLRPLPGRAEAEI